MNNLIVSASPHIRENRTTNKIMLDVIISLFPALIAATVIFGYRSLIITGICVISAVFFEYLCRLVMKREQTINDLSAVVTGMLTAYCLPVTIPLWMAAVGSFTAIVAVKQVFGGIGENFANPAAVARIVLVLSFSSEFSTKWTLPMNYNYESIDALASATPLASDFSGVTALDLFLGMNAGSLGETCALALLAGGCYLIIKKVIDFTVPLCFIGSAFLWSFLFGLNPVMQILSGGIMLGAFFMATDYTTTPMTGKGKMIFAAGCGTITMFIRFFGEFPEGVAFSIVLMNLTVPFIDRITAVKPFGYVLKKKKG